MLGRLRSPTGSAALVLAVPVAVAVATLAYAATAWSSRGLGAPLAGAAVLASATTALGTALRGRERVRASLGGVLAGSGALSVTVAATLPFVMRSGAWRRSGGPAFSLAPVLGFVLAALAVAVVGVLLLVSDEVATGRTDRRSVGRAPIRPGRDPGSTFGDDGA